MRTEPADVGKVLQFELEIGNLKLEIMAKLEKFEDMEIWKESRKLNTSIFQIFQKIYE